MANKVKYNLGFNSAIIDSKTKDQLCLADAKSAEIIKPILRGRDIGRYSTNWAGLWVIFIPWHFPLHKDTKIFGSSIDAEKAFEKDYPVIYKNLLNYKKELLNRNKAETGIRYEWYSLQRCAATYYEDFAKNKVIYGQFRQGEFTFEDKEVYLSSNEYMIISQNKEINLKYIIAILNSKINKFYSSLTMNSLGSAATIAQKSIFEQLPIPQISAQEQEQFVALACDMLNLHQQIAKISDDFLTYLKAKTGNPQKLNSKILNWHCLDDDGTVASLICFNFLLVLRRNFGYF